MAVCKKPFFKDGLQHGCGQCMPCRIRDRRIWTHRLMLETHQHKESCFVTLTYDPSVGPLWNSLRPLDLRRFMYRLRTAFGPKTVKGKKIEGTKLRFYAVGEYGDLSERPHFHLALFGTSCAFGRSTYSSHRRSCCPVCDTIAREWTHGNVWVDQLNQTTAQYIAGYVTKKMTNVNDPRLHGRHPEFARMSRRPGIGGFAMDKMADKVLEYSGGEIPNEVPMQLQHGKQKMPLGRYLKNRVERLVFYIQPLETDSASAGTATAFE